MSVCYLDSVLARRILRPNPTQVDFAVGLRRMASFATAATSIMAMTANWPRAAGLIASSRFAWMTNYEAKVDRLMQRASATSIVGRPLLHLDATRRVTQLDEAFGPGRIHVRRRRRRRHPWGDDGGDHGHPMAKVSSLALKKASIADAWSASLRNASGTGRSQRERACW